MLQVKNMDNNKKTYLTKEGLVGLKKEYDELVNKKRPEIIARVSQARNMGDLSENAEYAASREELSFIDGRIDELEELLKQAVVVGNTTSHSIVKIGSKVTVKMDGKREKFTVVGEMEANPVEKKISHQSPLGRAIIGKKVGEKVEVEAPVGGISYVILEIQ